MHVNAHALMLAVSCMYALGYKNEKPKLVLVLTQKVYARNGLWPVAGSVPAL
jgi:hypothetical protein